MDKKMSDLLTVMNLEKEKIEMLLELLRKQNEFVIKKDIFKMEECAEELQNCSKELAQYELKRRELTNGRDIKKIVNESDNDEIKNIYKEIKSILERTITQKETNEILLRQNLYFTNNMLAILKPDRSSKTYNSYGKVQR